LLYRKSLNFFPLLGREEGGGFFKYRENIRHVIIGQKKSHGKKEEKAKGRRKKKRKNKETKNAEYRPAFPPDFNGVCGSTTPCGH